MPGTPVRAGLFVGIIVVAGACAADAPLPTPGVAVTAAWTLSPEPVLEIGGDEGPPELVFTTIASAFALPDGRIVVANRSAPAEVRVFSPEGAYQQTLGGDGERPGEFREITWARTTVDPDTLVVYDPRLQRVSWFSVTDGLARVEAAVLPGLNAASGDLTLLAPVHGGRFLARPNPVAGGESGGSPGSPLLLIRFDLPALDTLLVLTDAQQTTSAAGPASSGEEGAIAYRAGRVFIGRGDELRIDEYDLAGTHVRTFLRPEERRAEGEGGQAALTARIRAARAATIDDADAESDEQPSAEVPPRHLLRMLVDDTGHLWVEEYSPPGSPRIWSVFDPVGVWLCSVQVPRDLTLTAVRRETVYGIHRDEAGVQRVLVYGLRR